MTKCLTNAGRRGVGRFVRHADRGGVIRAIDNVPSPVDANGYAEVPVERITGPLLASISNEMVRLYKHHFGRGPTKVRSYFAGPDVLVCVLEETFTPAERNLVAMGEQQRLRDTRTLVQYATEAEFTRIVEELTERRVIAFISGVDAERDVAAEMFVLEPHSTTPVEGEVANRDAH